MRGKERKVDGRDRVETFELLTTVEAASYLRVSVRTLEDKRVDGTGPPYFKVGPGRGAKVVYRRSDLNDWLKKFQFSSSSQYDR
jgi:hypothetical protein